MVANEKPNYYAIITAEVRYDKSLEYGARLLYAEITALSNKTGECFASNEYFSDVFEISEKTVRRWKQSLESNGYIHWDKKTGKISMIDNSNVSRGTKMSGGGDKNVRLLHIVLLIINLILILIILRKKKKKKKKWKKTEMRKKYRRTVRKFPTFSLAFVNLS